MKRITYEINEPEDFKALLDYWNKRKNYLPVFVHWQEAKPLYAAMFLIETKLYKAVIHIQRETPEEVLAVFEKYPKSKNKHLFVECTIYADEDDKQYLVNKELLLNYPASLHDE